MMVQDQPKPAIKIFRSMNLVDEALFREVISGVEEESVPYEVERMPDDECVVLGYKAAMASVLEVGIGVDGRGGIAVHYKKLPEARPLFQVSAHLGRAAVRSMSSNAARLVKGTPFILDYYEGGAELD